MHPKRPQLASLFILPLYLQGLIVSFVPSGSKGEELANSAPVKCGFPGRPAHGSIYNSVLTSTSSLATVKSAHANDSHGQEEYFQYFTTQSRKSVAGATSFLAEGSTASDMDTTSNYTSTGGGAGGSTSTMASSTSSNKTTPTTRSTWTATTTTTTASNNTSSTSDAATGAAFFPFAGLLPAYNSGDCVYFQCDPGYYMTGKAWRQCQPNGIWSGDLPICESSLVTSGMKVTSSEALRSHPADAAVDGDVRTCYYSNRNPPKWWKLDMSRTLDILAVSIILPTSDKEHNLTIYVSREKNGPLDQSTICSRHTASAKELDSGASLGKSSSNLLLSCKSNDSSASQSERRKGISGRYLTIIDSSKNYKYFGLCEVAIYAQQGHKECGSVEEPLNSYPIDYRANPSSVSYKCLPGYKLFYPQGNISERLCQSNGHWTSGQVVCEAIDCGPPVLGERWKEDSTAMAKAFSTGGDQLNLIDSTSGSESETTSTGSIVLLNGSTTYGSLGRLFCPNGTIMFGLGNRIIQCQENGFWSKLGTFCLPINRTNEANVTRIQVREESSSNLSQSQVTNSSTSTILTGPCNESTASSSSTFSPLNQNKSGHLSTSQNLGDLKHLSNSINRGSSILGGEVTGLVAGFEKTNLASSSSGIINHREIDSKIGTILSCVIFTLLMAIFILVLVLFKRKILLIRFTPHCKYYPRRRPSPKKTTSKLEEPASAAVTVDFNNSSTSTSTATSSTCPPYQGTNENDQMQRYFKSKSPSPVGSFNKGLQEYCNVNKKSMTRAGKTTSLLSEPLEPLYATVDMLTDTQFHHSLCHSNHDSNELTSQQEEDEEESKRGRERQARAKGVGEEGKKLYPSSASTTSHCMDIDRNLCTFVDTKRNTSAEYSSISTGVANDTKEEEEEKAKAQASSSPADERRTDATAESGTCITGRGSSNSSQSKGKTFTPSLSILPSICLYKEKSSSVSIETYSNLPNEEEREKNRELETEYADFTHEVLAATEEYLTQQGGRLQSKKQEEAIDDQSSTINGERSLKNISSSLLSLFDSAYASTEVTNEQLDSSIYICEVPSNDTLDPLDDGSKVNIECKNSDSLIASHPAVASSDSKKVKSSVTSNGFSSRILELYAKIDLNEKNRKRLAKEKTSQNSARSGQQRQNCENGKNCKQSKSKSRQRKEEEPKREEEKEQQQQQQQQQQQLEQHKVRVDFVSTGSSSKGVQRSSTRNIEQREREWSLARAEVQMKAEMHIKMRNELAKNKIDVESSLYRSATWTADGSSGGEIVLDEKNKEASNVDNGTRKVNSAKSFQEGKELSSVVRGVRENGKGESELWTKKNQEKESRREEEQVMHPEADGVEGKVSKGQQLKRKKEKLLDDSSITNRSNDAERQGCPVKLEVKADEEPPAAAKSRVQVDSIDVQDDALCSDRLVNWIVEPVDQYTQQQWPKGREEKVVLLEHISKSNDTPISIFHLTEPPREVEEERKEQNIPCHSSNYSMNHFHVGHNVLVRSWHEQGTLDQADKMRFTWPATSANAVNAANAPPHLWTSSINNRGKNSNNSQHVRRVAKGDHLVPSTWMPWTSSLQSPHELKTQGEGISQLNQQQQQQQPLSKLSTNGPESVKSYNDNSSRTSPSSSSCSTWRKELADPGQPRLAYRPSSITTTYAITADNFPLSATRSPHAIFREKEKEGAIKSTYNWPIRVEQLQPYLVGHDSQHESDHSEKYHQNREKNRHNVHLDKDNDDDQLFHDSPVTSKLNKARRHSLALVSSSSSPLREFGQVGHSYNTSNLPLYPPITASASQCVTATREASKFDSLVKCNGLTVRHCHSKQMNQSLIEALDVDVEASHSTDHHSLSAPFAPVTNEYANLLQLTSSDTAGSNEPIYENVFPTTATAPAINSSSSSSGDSNNFPPKTGISNSTTGGSIDFSTSASSFASSSTTRADESTACNTPTSKVNAANGESKIPLLNWQICKNKGLTSGLQAAPSNLAHRPSVRL